MNKKTLKALKGSIKKWEGIVAGTMLDLGPINCPLCSMFWLKDCAGCPVMAKTKKMGCVGTPYQSYTMFPSGNTAQRELDFLKSLLPNRKDTPDGATTKPKSKVRAKAKVKKVRPHR